MSFVTRIVLLACTVLYREQNIGAGSSSSITIRKGSQERERSRVEARGEGKDTAKSVQSCDSVDSRVAEASWKWCVLRLDVTEDQEVALCTSRWGRQLRAWGGGQRERAKFPEGREMGVVG